MKTALIACHGYLGDHLFANSIAERLLSEGQFDVVDYVVGFPQIIPFFERNPYVRTVFHPAVGPSPRVSPSVMDTYSRVFQLQPITRKLPPALELQLACGVQNPSPEFRVVTNPDLDSLVLEHYGEKDRTTVAIMNGWDHKTFRFTREEYARGIDVPNLGYGGAHRNTDWIVDQLSKRYNVVMVGVSPQVSQFVSMHEDTSFDLTASILKYCDFFVGAEGGLANLAYAVGTRTVITSDFVHQLYGPNGVIGKLDEPKLGPVYYGGTVPHINLDPYLTDEEVLDNLIAHLG